MAVTVNLAKGALAMARSKVIVKRLDAIQNLGAMDVLCTGKTGTLTQDKIILKQHVDIHGTDSPRVLHYAYLNSYFYSGLKNLLDVAVLEHGDVHEALRVDEHSQKIGEIPFDFSRRRLSVIVSDRRDRHISSARGRSRKYSPSRQNTKMPEPSEPWIRDILRRLRRRRYC